MKMLKFYLLPPANEVCEGSVFTGVCLSTGGWVCIQGVGLHRGGCIQGGEGGGLHPSGKGSASRRGGGGGSSYRGNGGLYPGGGVGIRSMSGRYASYWNAVLLT